MSRVNTFRHKMLDGRPCSMERLTCSMHMANDTAFDRLVNAAQDRRDRLKAAREPKPITLRKFSWEP